MPKPRSVSGALVVIACAVIATSVLAETTDPLPVTVEHLNEKVLSVRSGEQYFDAVLVVESKRGLVVIDTGIAPSFTRVYRAKIEEALGRRDFAWVINTHSHFDHIAGNHVFPEATTIASAAAREGMLEWSRDLDTFVARQRGRVETWTRQAENAGPESPQGVRFSNLATLYGRASDDLTGEFTFIAPSVTFGDRMTLHLGDMTAHLYSYGPGTHVGDDIIVHVPEVGLVAVGDLFGPGYVQPLQGNEPGVDLDHKLAVLDAVLADEASSQVVINGHGARMSRAELVARRDYLAALTRAAREEAAESGTFIGLQGRLPLDGEIAFLRTLGITEPQLAFEHRASLAVVWQVVRGLEDGAERIERVVRGQGVDAAHDEFARMLPLNDERFFIDENALNRLGYILLGEGRTDDAVAVFEMNVKAFPESWNVHDSLGEGLAARGETERAVASYERSLQLNPDNTNAVTVLERLRAGD